MQNYVNSGSIEETNADSSVKTSEIQTIKDPNQRKKMSWKKDFQQNWSVYVLFLPAFIFFLVLSYFPMFGIIMAFENFKIPKGFFGSEWVGLNNFQRLFEDVYFWKSLGNTAAIGLLKITVGFVMPIIFAVLLSLLRSKKYKRTVQTLSYMPNFVAAVVICALLSQFVGTNGPLSVMFAKLFHTKSTNWLASNTPLFWFLYVFMGIWQGIGWGSIMYVASISMVNGDLHEAAALDGATRMQRVFHITLPCIMPMIVMMFVMNVGLSFTTGFESVLLLQMPSTYDFSDTVYTYTYRFSFMDGNKDYSLSAASGLFQSVIGTILLVGSNILSKKATDGISLF